MPGSQAIDGISSGLDTTSIVDAMISFERTSAVYMEQEQAEKTNMVSALKAAQAKFLALSSQVSLLQKSETYEKASISLTDESYFSATRSGQVGSGAHDLRVIQLARNHQLASQGVADVDQAIMGTGSLTISLGNGATTTIAIDESNNTLVGIKDAINKADVDVTASIINDGTDANSFRLVLSASKSGADNQISVTTGLTGGVDLNFATATFDSPETNFNTSSTTTVSLGASASYTGTENKTFTFTVAGTGEQQVGTDTITLNWTDGTNSGSIEIAAAATEVEITGAGGDGLYLQLAAGTINAGDKFTVDTFTPLLQQASDAIITIGSTDGGGSPITVTSSSNSFSDVVSGLSITAKKVTPDGESVGVTTAVDTAAIKASIKQFISAYNDLMDYIDDQNKYDVDTGNSGILFGDSTLWTSQNSMRSALTSVVRGVEGKYNSLYTLGITHSTSGRLSLTHGDKLNEAIDDDLSNVINIFTDSGQSSNQFVEFISLTPKSKPGHIFDVDISQAATKGEYVGSSLGDLVASPITLDSSSNRIQIKVDGSKSAELTLAEGTYDSSQELVSEIQKQIDADTLLGSRGIEVTWDSDAGALKFTSGSYGSDSSVEMDLGVANSAHTILGLSAGTATAGLDVTGTINGEEAEGKGQILTGAEGNDTTEGVKLKVSLTPDQVSGSIEGNITISRGVGTRLYQSISRITESKTGVFDTRISALEKQIEDLAERIVNIDERLAVRRESLMLQFWDMEQALGEMNAQQSYLTSQLSSLDANWQFRNK